MQAYLFIFEWVPRTGGPNHAALRAALAVALMFVSPGLAPAAEPAPSANAADLAGELRAFYRTQTAQGAFAPGDMNAFIGETPVLATLALDVCRRAGDVPLLSQTASAASRYYGYLFSERDTNGDMLIDTGADLQSVGYNTMLALDMMSVSQINLDLRRPLRALYWYEGARTLQERIVIGCYDVNARSFYPTRVTDGSLARIEEPLAALPVLFSTAIGDNLGAALVRDDLLSQRARLPENPVRYLMAWGDDNIPGGRVDAAVVRAMMLLRALDAHADPTTLQEYHATAIRNATRLEGRSASAREAYLVELLAGGAAFEWYDDLTALDIFVALSLAKRYIGDVELIQLGENVTLLRDVARASRASSKLPPQTTVAHADAEIEAALRSVFFAVSNARDRLDEGTYFTGTDARAMPSVNLDAALARLLDDVTWTLWRIENVIHERKAVAAGVKLTATIGRERVAVGERVGVTWTVQALGRGVELSEFVVHGETRREVVVGKDQPMALGVGELATFDTPLMADGANLDALALVKVTATLTTGGGEQIHRHLFASVYLNEPYEVIAEFPEGKVIRGATVPIDIVVTRRIDKPGTVQIGWFSPSGLQLAGGGLHEIALPADAPSVTGRLIVEVPQPCRPGAFPFRLKFLGDGRDIGTIHTALFKPYQWAGIGTFDPAKDPMRATYPPDREIMLGASYTSSDRKVYWTALTENATNNNGEVSAAEFMDRSGIGFLYTVVETPFGDDAPVRFAATANATLNINGRQIARFDPNSENAPLATTVTLNPGLNDILIKLYGDADSRVFFVLGSEDVATSVDYNNDLHDLVDGYSDLYERTLRGEPSSEPPVRFVTLRYTAPQAASVAVIGSFNGWTPERSQMKRDDAGVWEIRLSLPPGEYAYRFLVNNREQVLDPTNPLDAPDGYGGKNSILVVTE